MADKSARVLQIVEPPPGGASCLLRMVLDVGRRGDAGMDDLLVVGSSRDAMAARKLGARPALLPRSTIGAWPKPRALSRWLRRREANAAARYDLIRIWSGGGPALAGASLLGRPVHAVLVAPPRVGRPVRTVHQLAACHDARISALGVATFGAIVRAGIETDRLHTAQPGVEVAAEASGSRTEIRSRWDVGDETLVIGVLAEPMFGADALLAAEMALRFVTTGRRGSLIVSSAAAHRGDAERLLARMDRPDVLVLDGDAERPWEIAAGLDVALCLGGARHERFNARRAFSVFGGDIGPPADAPVPSPLPMIWAMAHGVPVIAEDHAPLRAALGEEGAKAVITPGDLNEACHRLVEWHDDPEGRTRTGDVMRDIARRRFELGTMIDDLRRTEAAIAPVREAESVE